MSAANRYIEMLANDGLLFIALSGDSEDKAKLIHHFQGQPIDIDTLVFNCIYYDSKSLYKILGN